MIDLKGHSALVTGSSKGVGRAIAIAYAKAGANVVIHGRSPSPESDQVLQLCRDQGVRATFIGGDLSGPTESAVHEVYAAAIEAEPELDILVNNAGQYFDLPFLEMTYERFEKTMRLNVASAYFLTQLFARKWIAGHMQGRVVMIGSINGRLAEPDSTCYDTSKGALEMMVRTLAASLACKGVRVNGMAPGLVRTPQTSWLDQRPLDAKWMAHHTPNQQVPDAEVCAPAAVFLASDAAWHIHGQMLLVDGGQSVWQQPHREPWQPAE
jgi:NAD(P)-dependent dehydrogenase (short-subunit alcohol dehydrogenase family)